MHVDRSTQISFRISKKITWVGEIRMKFAFSTYKIGSLAKWKRNVKIDVNFIRCKTIFSHQSLLCVALALALHTYLSILIKATENWAKDARSLNTKNVVILPLRLIFGEQWVFVCVWKSCSETVKLALFGYRLILSENPWKRNFSKFLPYWDQIQERQLFGIPRHFAKCSKLRSVFGVTAFHTEFHRKQNLCVIQR